MGGRKKEKDAWMDGRKEASMDEKRKGGRIN